MAYSNKPRTLDSLLRDFMKRIPQKKELRRGMILHFWPEVVGEQVSGITKKVHFERDMLIVEVKNEAWRHELHMNRFSIKKKLNEKVGDDIVKDVIVRC
jgi:predicted nucleic acid-binding Zn ribbon protein